MDLDEIQTVQSRERQTDSLQQLRDSFYEEAGEFVRTLRAEREQAAERADDPFDSPEVNRLSDDITTAEQTLSAIYERRVGKIVKMASLAAADMPTEEDGLTAEERDLFETLVASIEDNRQRVFDILEGADPGTGGPAGGESADQPVGNPPEADPEQPSAGPPPTADGETDVSAADLMSADGSPTTDAPDEEAGGPGEEPNENDDASILPDETRGDGGVVTAGSDANGAVDSTTENVDRTTIRLRDDVGEILGVDDRSYDLATDDVVELPDTNAKPLLEAGAAERLE